MYIHDISTTVYIALIFSCLPVQPCVSVGNVAQLAVDLLINSLQLSRVGYLSHDSILPLVGTAAYAHTMNTLHTAAEGDYSV